MARHFSTFTLISSLIIIGLILEARTAAAFSCTEALTYLLPCRSFLIDGVDNAATTAACCDGARALRQAAARQSSKRAVCRCLRQAAAAARVNPVKVSQLQQSCNLDFLQIPPRFDCNSLPASM